MSFVKCVLQWTATPAKAQIMSITPEKSLWDQWCVLEPAPPQTILGILSPNCVGSFKMAMVGNQCTVQSRVVFRWDRQLPTHRIAYAPFLSITQTPGRRSPWVYCCLYLIYQLMNKNVKPQIWNIDLSVSPFNCLSFCLLYLNLCY